MVVHKDGQGREDYHDFGSKTLLNGIILPPGQTTTKDLNDAIDNIAFNENVAPFISVLQAGPKSAPRYGLKIPDNNGWTYHTEMIPRWNPPYARGYSCVQVGPSNPKWQDEVAASCRRWADKGVISFSWDQYATTNDKPNLQDLTRRIRDYARSKDPQSTFSGEELWQVEIDAEWLDYTWNWADYTDAGPTTNVLRSPRLSRRLALYPAAIGLRRDIRSRQPSSGT